MYFSDGLLQWIGWAQYCWECSEKLQKVLQLWLEMSWKLGVLLLTLIPH